LKDKHRKLLRAGLKAAFGVYIIMLTYFLFFAESTGRTGEGRTYQYNLILFKEIERFITYRGSLGMKAVVLNLFGNVAAFLPFGMIVPMMSRRYRSLLHMTLLTFEFSLVVETIQLVCKVGSFDVDDLLLNTIGGMLGYLLFAVLDKIRRRKDSIHEKTS
jgi:glycopeptide antibiotics resistance protein